MQRDFSQLNSLQVDVLICGAGIYGAWTAYDAVLRGLKVAIVDQGDFAGATSSSSSKLIHGGLRYLESLDFKLVRKTLSERQMLLKTAPHRVWPLRFGVPVYKNSRLGTLQLNLGLTLYDLLAGNVPKEQHYHRYQPTEFLERFPCLDSHDLNSGFTYLDAQTDDARFVLELIAGATALGAVAVNYCQVTEFLENNGRVNGAVVVDKVTGLTSTIAARKVIDTRGRWTVKEQPDIGRLLKGIHLIMPKILASEALLLTAKTDGRVFFVIPWYGLTLLGTTDTDYQGNINHLTVESAEIDYLLSETNRVLKTVNWSADDVIGSFAGLRVVRQSNKKTPSAFSRDWQLFQADNGMLCSIGGKFTSAREDGQILVDKVCKQLNFDKPCQTFGKAFPWMPVAVDANSVAAYQNWEKVNLAKALSLNIDESSADWLLHRHGSNVSAIFQLCAENPALNQRIIPSLPFIVADLLYCAQYEAVVHLQDLLRRRLPLLILAKMSKAELLKIAAQVAPILAWDDESLNREAENCL